MAPQAARSLTRDDATVIGAKLAHLLQERQSILAELEPRAIPTIDPVAYQTAASHRLVLTDITAALDRLEAGTYGQCVRCGEQIAPERLDVIPHASACITCLRRAEAA